MVKKSKNLEKPQKNHLKKEKKSEKIFFLLKKNAILLVFQY